MIEIKQLKNSRFALGIFSVLVTIFLVALLLAFFSSYSKLVKEQEVARLEEKKAWILEKVYSTTTLSAEENKAVFDLIGNNKLHDYNLTKTEKFKLIEAFNKKQ